MNHTTMQTMPTTREIALEVVQKHAAYKQAAKSAEDYMGTAPRTPTNRLSKNAKIAIDAYEKAKGQAYNELEAAEGKLRESMHKDALACAGTTRHNTLKEITSMFAGATLVTSQWSDAEAAFYAQKSLKERHVNSGYARGNVFVLEIEQHNPAFKNVVSRLGYGSRATTETNDHVAHLMFSLNELGNLCRVRLYAGSRVKIGEDGVRHTANPIEDGFGIDLCRHSRGELSVSTFNGTTSEVRAWAAKIALAADCLEKLDALLEESRRTELYNCDLAKIATQILSKEG